MILFRSSSKYYLVQVFQDALVSLSFSFLKPKLQIMENFSTGLDPAPRADVKTGLAICLAELKQQKLLITIVQLLGPISVARIGDF